ncbi:hypothetical protein [Dyella sp. GSA-30]|uniref:hypothetical protein n=1 Tax=Dyella sp. GSA-30 TaxID=2994496 RepID=UPI0024923992|nr:hypothetical protein [Dyella sp. GSA-30]BDU22903.1 hypothetical protein DYGSA30_43600 [Dyella sp. GSA-30]
MSLSREFHRNFTVFAEAGALGVRILAGWDVLISKEEAIKYVTNYDRLPLVGFEESPTGVTLRHHGAVLALNTQEADAIVDLIRQAYHLPSS